MQPTAADLAVMGSNPLSGGHRQEIVETAIRTTHLQLEERLEMRAALRNLPLGAPHVRERPPGPPSTWPSFDDVAAARWSSAA